MTDRMKIAQLKKYFEKRDDVVMAFLFGSRATGRKMYDSDWDIAAYFKPQSGEIEFEDSHLEYSQENRMWADLAKILKTDKVDLLVLNRVPPNIADSAIRGIPLAIKDRGLWLKFMLLITGLAEDFREFARDYHEIFLRSASLAETDAERLSRIIEFLEGQTTLYAAFSNLTAGEYEADLIRRGAVERWVENTINAVADISKIVLSASKKTMPYGYADTVRRAALQLDLPKEFWDKFLNWIKLRNILAHEYLDVKWKRVSDFAQTSEPHIRQFIEAAKKFLKTQS